MHQAVVQHICVGVVKATTQQCKLGTWKALLHQIHGQPGQVHPHNLFHIWHRLKQITRVMTPSLQLHVHVQTTCMYMCKQHARTCANNMQQRDLVAVGTTQTLQTKTSSGRWSCSRYVGPAACTWSACTWPAHGLHMVYMHACVQITASAVLIPFCLFPFALH